MVINRFEVYLVVLDPTVGSEIQKTRPCLVVSPDEINHSLRTVIVAPLTTKGQMYPTRVPCRFKGKDGRVVLDQISNSGSVAADHQTRSDRGWHRYVGTGHPAGNVRAIA